MAVYLVAKEVADQYYLMHYRTKGSKNGIRRWQNEDGSYTSAGYQHYKEMYGWGDPGVQRDIRKISKLGAKTDTTLQGLRSAEYNKKAKTNIKSAGTLGLAALGVNRFGDRRIGKLRFAVKQDRLALLGAGAAGMAGAAAYNKVQSNIAKGLATDKGHRKAVEKYMSKFDEMIEHYKGTPYEKGMIDAREKERQRLKIDESENESVSCEEIKTGTVDPKEQKRRDDVLEYTGEYGWNKQNVSDLRAEIGSQSWDSFGKEEKRKLGNAWLDCLENVGNQIYESYGNGQKVNIEDHRDYNLLSSWLLREIDAKSGNWNVGEFKPGTNGEKAHDALNQGYEKTRERADKIAKENGFPNADTWRMSEKDYKKFRAALESDEVWKALDANDKKNERALAAAVLRDIGIPTNDANIKAIMPYVFYD